MTTYVYRNGKLVEKHLAEPLHVDPKFYVISDTTDPVRNHADGKIYDSKAKFRAATKAMGCVEIGNETLKPREPIKLDKRERREHIQRAIYDLRNGRTS
jgi:hypothetical protein